MIPGENQKKKRKGEGEEKRKEKRRNPLSHSVHGFVSPQFYFLFLIFYLLFKHLGYLTYLHRVFFFSFFLFLSLLKGPVRLFLLWFSLNYYHYVLTVLCVSVSVSLCVLETLEFSFSVFFRFSSKLFLSPHILDFLIKKKKKKKKNQRPYDMNDFIFYLYLFYMAFLLLVMFFFFLFSASFPPFKKTYYYYFSFFLFYYDCYDTNLLGKFKYYF